MATTPNYSWVMPDPTDFVTDLPADFEIFGDAVDASLYALSPGTTAGDLDYYTSGTAKARLGIGTAGQVLAVNAGATAPEWITAGGSGKTFTLLNSPSTTLSGSTVTISSIGGYDQFFIMIFNASGDGVGVQPQINVRFNGDTGSNYGFMGGKNTAGNTYSSSDAVGNINQEADTFILLAKGGAAANATVNCSMLISGANSSGVKIFEANTGSSNGSGSLAETRHFMGTWTNVDEIDSISFILQSGNFDSGNVKVYGAV